MFTPKTKQITFKQVFDAKQINRIFAWSSTRQFASAASFCITSVQLFNQRALFHYSQLLYTNNHSIFRMKVLYIYSGKGYALAMETYLKFHCSLLK